MALIRLAELTSGAQVGHPSGERIANVGVILSRDGEPA
jgi:hypothetical protein